MRDSASVSVVILLTSLLSAVGLAALVLYLRDRIARAQGKTAQQVNAPFFLPFFNFGQPFGAAFPARSS